MKICVDCKEEVEKVNRKGRCFECAMEAAADVVMQLHDHSGPYYERWKKAVTWRKDKGGSKC